MIKVKPSSLKESVSLFFTTSLIIYIGLYFITPQLLKSGTPFLALYFILFHGPLVLMFPLTFILYKNEGNQFNWRSIKERLRFTRPDRKSVIWALGLLLWGLLCYAALWQIGNSLAAIPFFAPPDFFPPELNPNKQMASGLFMGYPLKGNWWILGVYLFAWITNVLGEEFLWRGYLLPRQELAYGKKTWLIHGSMWTLWHFFWKWNLLWIFPWSLGLAYAVQKTKNTWVSIFAHGVMNFIPIIMIIQGIIS
jgi:membrane protease YdiL (CAAX protease family)